MKIGIITFHRAKNIGAMLQAYALQQVVEKKLGTCEIIDYRNKEMENNYKIKKISELKGIKNIVKYILTKKKNENFELVRDNFNSNIQRISEKIYYDDNIDSANKEYDAFITGSDQVWNMKLNYNDMNFFLKFVNDDNKKNAYAASFGNNIVSEEYKEILTEELSKFKNLSVREIEGKEIVRKLTNKECEIVLDPTLLMNKDEWCRFIDDKRIEKEKYIFVYLIAPTQYLIKAVRDFSKKKNCKVICFHNGYKKYQGMVNLNKLSPQEFINYIKNAEYVVTSSFHGLCFSINLHKEFYYELDKTSRNNNSRITSLINTLKISDREIKNFEICEKNIIDYEMIEKKLELHRKKSFEFIFKF